MEMRVAFLSTLLIASLISSRNPFGSFAANDPSALKEEFRRLGITEYDSRGEVVDPPTVVGNVHEPRSAKTAKLYRELGRSSIQIVMDPNNPLVQKKMNWIATEMFRKLEKRLKKENFDFIRYSSWIVKAAFLHGMPLKTMKDFLIQMRRNGIRDISHLPDDQVVTRGINLGVLRNTAHALQVAEREKFSKIYKKKFHSSYYF